MRKNLFFSILVVIVVIAAVYIVRMLHPSSVRAARIFAWIKNPTSQPGLAIEAGTRCGNAPFLFPTSGVAGYLWDESFQIGSRA